MEGNDDEYAEFNQKKEPREMCPHCGCPLTDKDGKPLKGCKGTSWDIEFSRLCKNCVMWMNNDGVGCGVFRCSGNLELMCPNCTSESTMKPAISRKGAR